jgi:phage tail-like protein
MASKRPMELLDFRFLVEIDGIAVGGFSEVSGLEQKIETEEYREGGSHFVHQLPKAVVQSTLSLKKGLSDADALWKWFDGCRSAVLYKQPLERKNISVIVFDESRTEQARFLFAGAYPVKWTGPTLTGTGSAVAIEQLEIAHEGMQKV